MSETPIPTTTSTNNMISRFIGRIWLLLSVVFSRIKQRFTRRSVPVLLQLNAVECGAACLAMILNYYGHKISVAECNRISGVGRDGLTARTIVESARNFGLRTKAYKVPNLEVFQHVALPAIIHWDFNHFVIVEKWSPTKVVIVDPAIGRRILTQAEFDEGFTGVAMTLEPGAHFERRNTAEKPLWQLYLKTILGARTVKTTLLQVMLTSLFLQAIGLVFPFVTQILVDRILPNHLDNLMLILGAGLLILVVAQMLVIYLRSVLLIYLRTRLDAQQMLGFFEHLLSLPLGFFQERSSGDLIMRLNSNRFIRETLTNQTLSTVLDGTFVIGYLFILWWQSPLYGVIALALGTVQIVILLVSTKMVREVTQRNLITQSESQSYLYEALAGITTIKAAGTEPRVFDFWSNLFFKGLNVSAEKDHLNTIVSTLLSTIRAFSPFILLWVGAIQVLDGTMTLGMMLALNALATAFLLPLTSLLNNGQQLQHLGAELDRLGDILKAAPEQQIQDVQTAPQLSGAIALNNVSFGYDEHSNPILQDISVDIKAGQKVAIVGRTGAGKTTLGMLLLGMYRPRAGSIAFDDMPLETLNYQSVRQQFGVVTQDSFLFDTSILENIRYNNPTLGMKDTVMAAYAAAIHNDIMQMPMGYETRVAERGAGLSGGQRQRLSLARALATKPAIMLLDEATSHLDELTEQHVERSLDQLGCTRIVIAHRLSTVRNADLILVLDNGRIVEQGTHEALLNQHGYYASLIQPAEATTTAHQDVGV